MNFVTYETAVRLKEAGFLQPEQEAFQVWYMENGVPVSIETGFANTTPGLVYAPTADDILRELPDFAMYYGKDFTGDMIFSVYDTLFRSPYQYPTHHGNAAEAAALAWFEYFKMERSGFPENESES